MNVYIIVSISFAFFGMFAYNIGLPSFATLLGVLSALTLFVSAIRNVIHTVNEQYSPTPETAVNTAFPPEQGSEKKPRPTAAAKPKKPAKAARPTTATPSPPLTRNGKPLAGMSFALTRQMPVKRIKMECLIEYYGGTVHKNIRKDTTYLLKDLNYGLQASGKETKAEKWHIPTLSVEELADMCGFTTADIRYNYARIVPVAELDQRIKADNDRKELREFSAAAKNLREQLKQIYVEKLDILLSKAVKVIVSSGDDMELATVGRLKYNSKVGDYLLYSTDGEAIYLDDVRECSIKDLLKAVAV